MCFSNGFTPLLVTGVCMLAFTRMCCVGKPYLFRPAPQICSKLLLGLEAEEDPLASPHNELGLQIAPDAPESAPLAPATLASLLRETQMPGWMPREHRALLAWEAGTKGSCALGRPGILHGGPRGMGTESPSSGRAVGGRAWPPPGRPGWENHDGVEISFKTFPLHWFLHL